MRRTTVLVVFLLVVSGCNALPSGESGAGDGPTTDTLTPAPVPEGEAVRTPTPTPTECLAPRVAADERTSPPTPATPVAFPTDNGTVSGADIVATHRAALSNHSFELRMDGTRVRSMPGATAFTYEGVTLGFESVRVFAAAGTLYRLHRVDGGVAVSEEPYRAEGRYRDALTGTSWLAERVGPFAFRQVDTREWNGTEVRVFREARDVEFLVGAGEALEVESTVLVDRRGVVRQVRHVRTLRTDEGDEVTNTTEVDTFAVPEVGSVTVSRPEAFCVPESRVVTATPANGSATPVTAEATVAETETDDGPDTRVDTQSPTASG